ncbi:hypothetical protein WJX84_006687 [Apatococcus fuscideae]|uniref:FAD-binding domain-containing protein n=1 Tax=Apatococcus fuscideae TaxID=2026836 RepID=A0AAW1RUS5_9CHLO
MSILAGKHICIAGAGIGGTCLAVALEKACKDSSISPLPKIELFERDASSSARQGVGYSFNLRDHQDTGSGGLKVLKDLELGIFEELAQCQEPGNTMHLCLQNFKQPLIQVARAPGEDPRAQELMRISRSQLRQTLLYRVTSGIHWGKVCTSAVPAAKPGGHVQLGFSDGSAVNCDLLVVADGTRSKLRACLLPRETNSYAGICMLMGRTEQLKELPPELLKGQYLAMGQRGVALFMCSVEKTTAMWSLSWKAPESTSAELNAIFQDPSAAQEYLTHEVQELAKGFPEPLPSLLHATKATSMVSYPCMDKLPHPNHDNGVVYLGDAWHPMSPFSGSGANMALVDAWELAQQLVTGRHTCIQEAIDAYATHAAPRARGEQDLWWSAWRK